VAPTSPRRSRQRPARPPQPCTQDLRVSLRRSMPRLRSPAPSTLAACPGTPHPVPPRARRLPWADLLRRVFVGRRLQHWPASAAQHARHERFDMVGAWRRTSTSGRVATALASERRAARTSRAFRHGGRVAANVDVWSSGRVVDWTEYALERCGAFFEPAPAPGGSTAGSEGPAVRRRALDVVTAVAPPTGSSGTERATMGSCRAQPRERVAERRGQTGFQSTLSGVRHDLPRAARSRSPSW
jgi:hypothetical protein